ncbi:MAG: type VI secretion system tip protein VgrG, partial [Burkholderiales bacterium]|nr:type VI secretion system tip protein VgrG [Burkholderiales bacterium]
DKMTAQHPAFPQGMPKQKIKLNLQQTPGTTDASMAGMPYTLFADGAEVKKDVMDSTGQLLVDHEIVTQHYKLVLANGETYQIPVPSEYRNAEQATLANQGLQHHQPESNAEINQPDQHTDHRQSYLDTVKGLFNAKGKAL